MIASKSASACIRKSRISPSETDSTTLESTEDSHCGLTVASRLDICFAALRLTSANRTCSSTCCAGGAWSRSTTVAPVPRSEPQCGERSEEHTSELQSHSDLV